jgi:hypothetical protein
MVKGASKSSRTSRTRHKRGMKHTRGATDDTSPTIRAEIALVTYTHERFWTHIGIAYGAAATNMSMMGMVRTRRTEGSLPFPIAFLAKASYGYLREMARLVLVRRTTNKRLTDPSLTPTHNEI